MEIKHDHKHNFRESTIKDYKVCIECGTYHSTNALPPPEVYEVPYWGDGTGRSTLDQQISNMTCLDECGVSKIDRVLQFVQNGKAALEIAAAPGRMLQCLLDKGYEDVFGIEPNIIYVDFICRQAPSAKVIHGYFPDVFDESSKDMFDCIIGMDILEHVPDYGKFINAIHRLLVNGGTAILMSPISYEDGFIRSRDFKSDEHIWLFSKKYLEPY